MLTDPNPDDPLVPEIAHVSVISSQDQDEADWHRHTSQTDLGMRRLPESGQGSKLKAICWPFYHD